MDNIKFELPKQVKVGAHIYKVLYPYHFSERVDLNGQADADLGEIRISGQDACGNQRIDSALLVTLWHEILHCIDRVYFGNKILETKDLEQLIEGLAQGIAQVLVDWDNGNG